MHHKSTRLPIDLCHLAVLSYCYYLSERGFTPSDAHSLLFERGFTPSDPHSLLGSVVNGRFGNRVKVSRKTGKLFFKLSETGLTFFHFFFLRLCLFLFSVLRS